MLEWKAAIQPTHAAVKVLVRNFDGDVLKALLPGRPRHPGALLALLEGVALWEDRELVAAVSVDGLVDIHPFEDLFGGNCTWPEESALVRFRLVKAPRRQRRLEGLGDFRTLYQVHERWNAE